MRATFLAAALALGGGFAARASEPSVSVTGQTYDPESRTMKVTYSLTADSALIVTFDVVDCSDVSIGATKLRKATGDVNRLVEPGEARSFVWFAESIGGDVSAVTCKAVVKAWPVDNPPDVMVVDLIKGSGGKYAASYYPSLDVLPDGLTENLAYKTTKLVMKRVHRPVGDKWIMGSYDECSAKERGNETQHEVTIGADYWLGVFELTQYQAFLINDNRNLNSQGGATWRDGLGGNYGIRPLENTCFNFIRGGAVAPTAPTAGSVLGKLKDRTGYVFDFPSEAQWEYAARAGQAPGKWGDGSKMALGGSANPWTQGMIADTNLNPQACYSFNPSPTGGTMPVGSFKPNGWGFHDMHGNVSEMCIDYWVSDITQKDGVPQVKEGEPSDSDEFSIRGGSYTDTFFNCRPCLRNFKQKRNQNASTVGVRLYAPLAPAS